MFNAMKVTVTVMPKQSVLDPQGVAVRDAIHHHGMPQVKNVRIGKFLELEVDGTDVININYKDDQNYDAFRMPEVLLSQ